MKKLLIGALAAILAAGATYASTIVTRTGEGTTLTWAQLDANFTRVAQNKTANYTLAIGDNRDTVEFNGSSLTATLPVAATITTAADTGDYEVTLVNLNASALTVARSSTDTIGSGTSYSLAQYEAATFKVNHATTGWNVTSISIDATSLATLTGTQTLTNKTLTSPTISGPTLSGTVIGTYTIGGTPTFPSTVVSTTGTQTLTNKTLTSPVINTPTSTATCASGYTRITPNYCKKDSVTYANTITNGAYTTLTAPSASAVMVEVGISCRSNTGEIVVGNTNNSGTLQQGQVGCGSSSDFYFGTLKIQLSSAGASSYLYDSSLSVGGNWEFIGYWN